MKFFKSDNFHSFIWFQRIFDICENSLILLPSDEKKVPFYSLFCWIKRRQFFKALKIKAYLWHISCFVLPKLCDAHHKMHFHSMLLFCVSLYPILYDKSIIRFGVMIQSFCPTNGSCVGQFFYLFVLYQMV